MPGLNEAHRNNSIGRLEAGETQTAVATTFSTISRLWDRYRQHPSKFRSTKGDNCCSGYSICEIASSQQPLLFHPFLFKQLSILMVGIRDIYWAEVTLNFQMFNERENLNFALTFNHFIFFKLVFVLLSAKNWICGFFKEYNFEFIYELCFECLKQNNWVQKLWEDCKLKKVIHIHSLVEGF